MFGLSIWKLLIVLAIVLIIFGGRRLPDLGKALGQTITELKKIPGQASGEADRVNQPASPAQETSQATVQPTPTADRPTSSLLDDAAKLKEAAGTVNKLGKLFRFGRM